MAIATESMPTSTVTKMRAFVMASLDRVGFMDKPVPEPGPNDAVVKTTRALVCTSDSHTVHGAIGPRENLTLGHEAVGVVHAVGSEVEYFKPGDRVVVGAITPDWGDLASQEGHSSHRGEDCRRAPFYDAVGLYVRLRAKLGMFRIDSASAA